MFVYIYIYIYTRIKKEMYDLPEKPSEGACRRHMMNRNRLMRARVGGIMS